MRYMPERVLRQFGRVQTIPRHLVEVVPSRMNLGDISLCFQHDLDYTLTPEQLGKLAVHGVEATDGYIEWFYLNSHPHMVLPDIPIPVLVPPDREVLDARAA